MTDLPYPVRRETERMRRWLVTSGASPRLLTAVCASSELRAAVEAGLLAGDAMRSVVLDIRDGDIVPRAFRQYQGSHTAYTLFQFDGLADRVARDGVDALLSLEREEALFRRPATWALLWLDDPGLTLLLARHAPRLHALVELRPTFASPELHAAAAIERTRPHVTSLAGRGRSGGTDLNLAARVLLERGDLRGARRLLDERAFSATDALLIASDIAVLAGDPHTALATAAAAVACGGATADGLVRLAEIHLSLGDLAAARATATDALTTNPGPEAAVRATLTLGHLDRASDATLLAAVRAAAADDPLALCRATVAPSALSGASITQLLRAARTHTDGDPSLAADLDTRLGLHLAGDTADAASSSANRDAARALLTGPSERDDDIGARAGRGLARLALATAQESEASGDKAAAERAFAEAHERLDRGYEASRARGYVTEAIAHLWDRTAVAAAEQEIHAILANLEELRQVAETAGLRVVAFDALADHSRALRFARELALATGELDTLEALALDLTLPALERRYLEARAEHLVELGATGEAATALDRANAILRELEAR